jgi:hypothetical protein
MPVCVDEDQPPICTATGIVSVDSASVLSGRLPAARSSQAVDEFCTESGVGGTLGN